MAGVMALADAVAAELKAGLALDAGTLAAMGEALGEGGGLTGDARRAVDLALAARDCAELGHLAALLFSPDEEFLARLEPALARTGLDAAGAGELAEELARRAGAGALPVVLRAAEGAAIGAAPTPDEARTLARRLRPEATAPLELREILARRFGPEGAARLGALLRHCRLNFGPTEVFFLSTLLERAPASPDDAGTGGLSALLAWAAGLLSTREPHEGPRELLARRRRALAAQLRQARFAEEAQEHGSYEVRMAQGFRQGHVHGPDVERELALLDRACLLVLGVAGGSLEGGPERVDLGRAEDAEALLRLLSGPGADGGPGEAEG